jgi:hypothetical protein
MATDNALRPSRYLHTIHAAPECERLRGLYTDAFGGIVFHESYYPPEDRDAALLYVADHMIEVMSPRDPENMAFMYARYLAKAGPGYHSTSFRVADAEAAHRRCDELGIAINTKGPGLIFLHPRSTGGLIMELTDHRMPNDPWDLPNWPRDWAQGRADRPHALDAIVCAPRDPATAIAFLCGPLEGVAGEQFAIEWPQRASVTPVAVADARLLVLTPEDRSAGPLPTFSNGPNGGVYALAWNVADLGAAERWFAGKGLPLEAINGAGDWSRGLLLDGAWHLFREAG